MARLYTPFTIFEIDKFCIPTCLIQFNESKTSGQYYKLIFNIWYNYIRVKCLLKEGVFCLLLVLLVLYSMLNNINEM